MAENQSFKCKLYFVMPKWLIFRQLYFNKNLQLHNCLKINNLHCNKRFIWSFSYLHLFAFSQQRICICLQLAKRAFL